MLITLNHVGRLKQGKPILQDVSWQINEGDKWILYGFKWCWQDNTTKYFKCI